MWSPSEGRYRGLDLFAGLRSIDVDLSVDLEPGNPAFDTTSIDAGDTFNDFMIGARYTLALSDRWDSRCEEMVRSATPKERGMPARWRRTG